MCLLVPSLFLFYVTDISLAVSSITKPNIVPMTSSNLSNALDMAFTADKSSKVLVNLNSSTPAYLNKPTINVNCFKQPAPPAPPLRRPVIMADYCKALQQIILSPDFLETSIWDLDPDPDTWLGWKSHDSGIFLGGHSSTVEAFAPAFVVQVAAVIAADCLDITTGYLGGIANAGPGGNVLVAVGALNYQSPSTNAADR